MTKKYDEANINNILENDRLSCPTWFLLLQILSTQKIKLSIYSRCLEILRDLNLYTGI